MYAPIIKSRKCREKITQLGKRTKSPIIDFTTKIVEKIPITARHQVLCAPPNSIARMRLQEQQLQQQQKKNFMRSDNINNKNSNGGRNEGRNNSLKKQYSTNSSRRENKTSRNSNSRGSKPNQQKSVFIITEHWQSRGRGRGGAGTGNKPHM